MKTQSPSGVGGWLKYYKESLLSRHEWSSPFKSGESVAPLARGFTANDLKKPLEVAKREKKKLLVYFTQLSCPPCRLVKEMTLASDEFQALLKDYVPVQIDIDVDVEPDKIKPLKVKGTPTFIVLDGDFKEIGRATRVMSPTAFKLFLQSLPPKAPIEAHNDDDPAWVADYDKLKTAEQKIEFMKNRGAENLDFNSHDWIYYMMAFYDPIMMLSLPQDQLLFTKAMALLGALEPRLKAAEVDELQKAYNLNTYYEVTAFLYEKKDRTKDAKATKLKQVAVLESFPRLPGVNEVTQVNVLKAEASEDPQKRRQVYEELKAKNQKDYTYDFWEASQLTDKKDYPAALASIEKSLAVAKDRSWQKAFLLKLEILEKMQKKEEALKLINDLLTQIKLPEKPTMKVHGFIQQLRRQQFSLAES